LALFAYLLIRIPGATARAQGLKPTPRSGVSIMITLCILVAAVVAMATQHG